MDWPGTRSGRWLDELPSGKSDAFLETVMLTGNPVLAVASPLSFHPPRSLWLRANGSSYVALVVSVCRISNCVLLRSHARQDICWMVVASPAPTDASVIACDHMYWVCHKKPFE